MQRVSEGETYSASSDVVLINKRRSMGVGTDDGGVGGMSCLPGKSEFSSVLLGACGSCRLVGVVILLPGGIGFPVELWFCLLYLLASLVATLNSTGYMQGSDKRAATRPQGDHDHPAPTEKDLHPQLYNSTHLNSFSSR